MQSKHHLKIQFKEYVGEEGIRILKSSIQHDLGLVERDGEQTVNIGYTVPINIPEVVEKIMQWWKEEMDSRIDKYVFKHGQDFSEDYIRLMEMRGFTFYEYLHFCAGQVDESDYHHHRVFEFLMMNDAIQRQQFISRLQRTEENDFEKYLALLAEYQVPPWSFFLHAKIPLYFPLSALKTHCYCVSQSGSGKSELLKLMFYDLARKSVKRRSCSLVLIEPHSDLCQEILGFLPFYKKQRDRVIYINPSINKLLGCKQRFTPVVNFFDIPSTDEETIDSFSQEIANAIGEMIKKPTATDDAFSVNMDAFLKPCIATLLRKGDSDLSELKRFMDDANNEDLVALGKQSPDPEHRGFFHNGFLNKRYKPTKDSVYIKIQSLLNSPLFRRLVIGKSTINLEEALNNGKIVIIDYAKGRGRKSAADFGRLMLAYIQAIATRRQDIPKAFRKQIYCFVDEFQSYVGSSIEEIMTEARKFGLSLILAHQVVGQKMNTALTDIIISNATLKIVGKNAKRSLEMMGANIDIPVDQLKKIPKYQFYIHNKDNERPAIRMKSPDFLVETSGRQNRFYMTKEEKQNLLWYFAKESGYYKEVLLAEEQGVEKIVPTVGVLERSQKVTGREASTTPLTPGLDL